MTTNTEDKHNHDEKTFDIVSTYLRLLANDPELTMPIAAIESLVLLLSQTHLTTTAETLDLLSSATAHLKASIPNPISLSAGTDLFQRYLVTSLQRPSADSGSSDFGAIRNHLVSNGRLFVKRAKEGRERIARYGRRFVRDGTTVMTMGASRVVGTVLKAAAEEREGSVRFRVIYVLSNSPNKSAEEEAIVQNLRGKGVPVASIPESAVAYSMGKVDVVIVGAEGVVENGGIISKMGTYQIGLLARSAGKPFYVMAETHKFVRLYPLGQYDLPFEQKVLNFTTAVEDEDHLDTGIWKNKSGNSKGDSRVSSEKVMNGIGKIDESKPKNGSTILGKEAGISGQDEAVDFTPPDLISALITESGVLTPSAVSEELIKIWY